MDGFFKSSAGANAAPWTRKSSPPNSRSSEAASAAICSSLVTSHGRISGLSSCSASSRTFSSRRSSDRSARAARQRRPRPARSPTRSSDCWPRRRRARVFPARSVICEAADVLFRALASGPWRCARRRRLPMPPNRPPPRRWPPPPLWPPMRGSPGTSADRPTALVARPEAIWTAARLADGEVGNGTRGRRLPFRPRQRARESAGGDRASSRSSLRSSASFRRRRHRRDIGSRIIAGGCISFGRRRRWRLGGRCDFSRRSAAVRAASALSEQRRPPAPAR